MLEIYTICVLNARYIVERGHRNNITICSKRGGREHIYTSNGRPLHVYIDTNKVAEDESDFLLHYKGKLKHGFWVVLDWVPGGEAIKISGSVAVTAFW